MKNLIVLLSGLFLLTLWSCSSDIDTDVNSVDVEEEVERVMNDQELAEIVANLTDAEKAFIAERKSEVLSAMSEAFEEAKTPQSDMRDAIKAAMTIGYNLIAQLSPPCPEGVPLVRFREFSEDQFFFPSFDHNCLEPNDWPAAVTAVLDEVLACQAAFGDCNYNPNITVNVVRSSAENCFRTRLVWRGWFPA